MANKNTLVIQALLQGKEVPNGMRTLPNTIEFVLESRQRGFWRAIEQAFEGKTPLVNRFLNTIAAMNEIKDETEPLVNSTWLMSDYLGTNSLVDDLLLPMSVTHLGDAFTGYNLLDGSPSVSLTMDDILDPIQWREVSSAVSNLMGVSHQSVAPSRKHVKLDEVVNRIIDSNGYASAGDPSGLMFYISVPVWKYGVTGVDKAVMAMNKFQLKYNPTRQ